MQFTRPIGQSAMPQAWVQEMTRVVIAPNRSRLTVCQSLTGCRGITARGMPLVQRNLLVHPSH